MIRRRKGTHPAVGSSCVHGVVENDPVGGTSCRECMADYYAKRADAAPAPASLLSVRVPVDLRERIRSAAHERGVSVNWFVSRLLVEGMANLRNDVVLTRPAGETDD
jgi:hypothetical protein